MEGASWKRRRDGRLANQLRPMRVEFGLIKTCDGSARLSMGDTKVLVAVHGPRPARSFRLEDPEAAQLDFSVVPTSGPAGPGEIFIASFLRTLFDGAVVRTAHPRSIISISVHVQVDEGSALCACVNAVTLALVHAGVPLHCMVGAVSAGIMGVGQGTAGTQPGGWASDALGAAAGDALKGSSHTGAVLDMTRVEEEQPLRLSDSTRAQSAAADLPGHSSQRANGIFAFSTSGIPDASLSPAGMDLHGCLSWLECTALMEEARAGGATVLAFLRLACRERVLREAVNFEPTLSVSVAELAGATVGAAPPPQSQLDEG